MKRILFACALAALAASAAADTYPSRPITMVVPFGAGGPTDALARIVAQRMSVALGQTVLVENVTGASGTVGIARVVRSAPDGYTIILGNWPAFVVASMTHTISYDVLADFEPVAMIAGSPMVLTTNPALGVRTLDEFIRLVRSKPGMSYGSSGNGSITHLAIERLKREAGIDLVHVPYKGTVPAVASVLSGDTALAFGTIPGVVPHAKAGKLVLLGASFGKRFSQIPDVPAIAETVPGYDMGFYTALFAPAKTPKEIVDKLHQEVVKAHAQPKVREIFANSAAEPSTMNPAQLKAYIAAEVRAWGDVVRSVGLKID